MRSYSSSEVGMSPPKTHTWAEGWKASSKKWDSCYSTIGLLIYENPLGDKSLSWMSPRGGPFCLETFLPSAKEAQARLYMYSGIVPNAWHKFGCWSWRCQHEKRSVWILLWIRVNMLSYPKMNILNHSIVRQQVHQKHSETPIKTSLRNPSRHPVRPVVLSIGSEILSPNILPGEPRVSCHFSMRGLGK
jgi:hypothetical protein